MKAIITPGKYTSYCIGGMATTVKLEIQIVTAKVLENGHTEIHYKIGGKRAIHVDRIREDKHILIPCWGLQLKVDSDFSSFSGNACFNFVADSIDIVKDYIENKAITEATPNILGACLFTPTSKAGGFELDGELVYPEVEIQHAVIARLKYKARQHEGQ